MKTPKEYAAEGGQHCPICASKPFNLGSDGSRSHDGVYIRRRCSHCGTDWTETCKVTGYVDLVPGPDVSALDNTREDEA